MKTLMIARPLEVFVFAAACLSGSGFASARGCVTGAAAGGVAGHVLGHHAIIGAAAGCAINHHRDAVKDKRAAQPSAAPVAPAPQPTPR